MGKTWLLITTELVSGPGPDPKPPPGRVFLVSPDHNFAELAHAINLGFARWDHSHLYEFRLPDGKTIGAGDEDAPAHELVADEVRVGSMLGPGLEFSYVFDFGDEWTHSCRVEKELAYPVEQYGEKPDSPVPVFGWGTIPDQYGRKGPRD